MGLMRLISIYPVIDKTNMTQEKTDKTDLTYDFFSDRLHPVWAIQDDERMIGEWVSRNPLFLE